MFSQFPPALYKGLAKKDGNLFCSPFSVQVALGMALAGAEGETRRRLALALDAPAVGFLPEFKQLMEAARPVKDEIELSTANALWADETFNIKPTYLDAVKNYDGDLRKVDFSNKSASCDTINSWVTEKTKDKIKQLITEAFINGNTRLILTNAIYFKGKWDKPFKPEKTEPETFYLGNGGQAKPPMMHQKNHFRYYENDLYQALEMPYQGLTTSMLVVLPKDKANLARLEEEWSDETYDLIVEQLLNLEVIVTIPKFKIATDAISLRDFLANEPPDGMGAGLAFSDSADFTGISDERLKISDVLHKAFVDVGEEGTEAAAATAVGMMRCASMRMDPDPKVFKADHPFLFAIRNRKTNTILFQGRLSDPA
jgi:serpin B